MGQLVSHYLAKILNKPFGTTAHLFIEHCGKLDATVKSKHSRITDKITELSD